MIKNPRIFYATVKLKIKSNRACTRSVTIDGNGTYHIIREYISRRDALLASFSFGRRGIKAEIIEPVKYNMYLGCFQKAGLIKNYIQRDTYQLKITGTMYQFKNSNIVNHIKTVNCTVTGSMINNI